MPESLQTHKTDGIRQTAPRIDDYTEKNYSDFATSSIVQLSINCLRQLSLPSLWDK